MTELANKSNSPVMAALFKFNSVADFIFYMRRHDCPGIRRELLTTISRKIVYLKCVMLRESVLNSLIAEDYDYSRINDDISSLKAILAMHKNGELNPDSLTDGEYKQWTVMTLEMEAEEEDG